MLAIYKREMRAYFTTPQGYIFAAVFLLASGFMFCMTTLQSQSSDSAMYFQMMMYGYIVLIPLLTMKSFAEERRSRTELLLLSSPVSLWGLVGAKFLAAFTMFFGTVAVSALYLPLLALYGTPNPARIIGCLIGIILIGACFIAIGLLVSSLTENQFAAALCTMGILAALIIVAVVNGIIDNYYLRLVLDWISIYSRFTIFTQGMFDFSAAFYYLSVCGVCLFACVRVFTRRRYA